MVFLFFRSSVIIINSISVFNEQQCTLFHRKANKMCVLFILKQYWAVTSIFTLSILSMSSYSCIFLNLLHSHCLFTTILYCSFLWVFRRHMPELKFLDLSVQYNFWRRVWWNQCNVVCLVCYGEMKAIAEQALFVSFWCVELHLKIKGSWFTEKLNDIANLTDYISSCQS